ncbi:hypothetical protein FACS189454_09390 [Planctomycetales bacterium]|nr:hypothetical protein FACS189454_09390 [Planctomycetales bacterium]
MKGRKFIIPDYQRPYRWGNEECTKLWDDITNADPKNDYFLGAFMTYRNKDDNEEIIDGQQRTTTLLLLLRAFYQKLEMMPEDEEGHVAGLKQQIEPCIWETDSMSKKVTDRKKIHIESQIIGDENRAEFHHILATGTIPEKAVKSPYAENYQFFLDKCDTYAKDKLFDWKRLCVFILDSCIVFPRSSFITGFLQFCSLKTRG